MSRPRRTSPPAASAATDAPADTEVPAALGVIDAGQASTDATTTSVPDATTAGADEQAPARSRPDPVNNVLLVGRISAVADPMVLPSGDSVVAMRLVVGREADATRPDARTQVDTLDIACWTAATQQAVAAIGLGGWAQVEGSLRRRFFRTAHGPASRYEVEAHQVAAVDASRPAAS